MARWPLDRLARLVARTREGRDAQMVAALMLGALLATGAVSIGLLPFVASESDFRVVRRAPGAADSDVFESYGFAQRYHVHRELRTRHPGAELILLEAAPSGWNLRQQLVAYGGAEIVCDADEVAAFVAENGGVTALIERLEASGTPQQWVGGDPRSGSVHRIIASADTTRFLVLSDARTLDIIGLDLVEFLFDQRCDGRG